MYAALLMLVLACSGVEETAAPTMIFLDGEGWMLATDPGNVGVAEKWWTAPRSDAKSAKVPGVIQDLFPGYSGAAWYWRDVTIPANPHEGGRYLLRFWDVDYVADVWVNGTHVGRHEGAQTKFAFDVTDAVKPDTTNRIAVRVLSVFNTPVDGIVRSQTPHGGFAPFNIGGIHDSVELLVTPQVRMDDLFVRADPKAGRIRVETEICNESKSAVPCAIDFAVAPAVGGEPVCTLHLDREVKPGVNVVSAEMTLANPRLWQLNDPFLYRMTGRIVAAGAKTAGENSTRFGFRDFRFENGAYRLNGHRLFWRSAHTGSDAPGNVRLSYDPDLLRRDMLDLKVMGFNAVRFISIMSPRMLLDLCDEIGLMVYEESHASWMLAPSPQLGERMDRSFTGMLLRDRNHPSVVMWGLLNETGHGAVFDHAVSSLPLMRRLDDSRVVMLGSGRFDAEDNFLNGLETWRREGQFAPCMIYNPKDNGISAVTLWRPREIAMLPGTDGEYAAVRWTSPADGEYAVSAKFRGTGTFTTTTVHLLQGVKPLYDGFINQNGRGDAATYSAKVHLAKGQPLDFLVGGRTPIGGDWYVRYGNSTSVAARIVSADGKTYDIAQDFSNAKNPAGPWSYGCLATGPSPDASSFKPYTKCETHQRKAAGSLSNPGSDHWEDVLADQHYYPRVPHRELEVARLRTIAANDNPIFLSEYGIGSAVDLPRYLRHCEQVGLENSDLANEIRQRQAAFMYAWEQLKLNDTFFSPENFFKQCVAKMAGLKRLGINAIRSNPNMVGYGMTGLNDPISYGEGIITAFRELKPGAVDAAFDGFYPVRWCTFAEPPSVYRGAKVRLEAVLANEDVIKPGQYPVRVEVAGPDNRVVFRKALTVAIPEAKEGAETPFAMPVFAEDVPIDGPSGKYRLMVTFEKGVAAAGGESEFYVTDPAEMPPVESDVSLWQADPELAAWLTSHGIKVHRYQPGKSNKRQVILVSAAPAGPDASAAWRDLAERIAEGSAAVFLTLDVFQRDGQPLGWLPLARKGEMGMVCEYTFPQVYPKDEWAKKHPLFDGLPCGGLMDYTFYRDIIPDYRYWGQEIPAEPVAGAFRTSAPAYQSELMLSVYDLGAGRFILNSFRVRAELGRDPTAERLLRNMLRYAAKNAKKPTEKLEPSTEELIRSFGY
jgi:hypothetical protein